MGLFRVWFEACAPLPFVGLSMSGRACGHERRLPYLNSHRLTKTGLGPFNAQVVAVVLRGYTKRRESWGPCNGKHCSTYTGGWFASGASRSACTNWSWPAMSRRRTYTSRGSSAVGVCGNLRPDDYVTSTHRGHGHVIAKGADLKRMMAELLGKRTGYCKGKGGSMHIADLRLNILGAWALWAAGLPIATGPDWQPNYVVRSGECLFLR